jgi:hypothetical protein
MNAGREIVSKVLSLRACPAIPYKSLMLNCWVLIINDWQEIPAFAGMTRGFDF